MNMIDFGSPHNAASPKVCDGDLDRVVSVSVFVEMKSI